MNSSVLVLANPSETAAQATRWAAVLGAPLQVRLELLHLCHAPEPSALTTPNACYSPAETAQAPDARDHQALL